MMFLLFLLSLLSGTAAPFAIVAVCFRCTVLDPLWQPGEILVRHLPQMVHVLNPGIRIEYIFGTEGMWMTLHSINFVIEQKWNIVCGK